MHRPRGSKPPQFENGNLPVRIPASVRVLHRNLGPQDLSLSSGRMQHLDRRRPDARLVGFDPPLDPDLLLQVEIAPFPEL